MTDPNTVLFFQDDQCYNWKVDEMARRDVGNDIERLLPYTEATRRNPKWRTLGATLGDIEEMRRTRRVLAA
jgi:hypothetical protein